LAPSTVNKLAVSATVENRKQPAHPAVRERFNEPVIVFLTVCSKDRKAIFAHADSVAVILDA
jgi:hypothetical protein